MKFNPSVLLAVFLVVGILMNSEVLALPAESICQSTCDTAECSSASCEIVGTCFLPNYNAGQRDCGLAFTCCCADCPAPVLTTITVSPSAATAAVGSTQTFIASPKDQFGNPISVTVTWSSSNTAVGTITNAGVFTAVAVGGPITITASSGGKSGTATATVTATPPPPGTECEIACEDKGYSDFICKGSGLCQIGLGEYDEGLDEQDCGMGHECCCKDPVPVLTGIKIDPASASVVMDSTQTFTATPKDQFGDTMNGITITWSNSNTGVGTIDSEGVFTAVATGTTTIAASSGTVSGTAPVTVTAEEPEYPQCASACGGYSYKCMSAGTCFGGGNNKGQQDCGYGKACCCITSPSIAVSASPSAVPPDGKTKSTITAVISPASSEKSITFSTTLGTLSQLSCATGSAGTCSVTISSTSTGTAIITASATGYGSATTSVEFTTEIEPDLKKYSSKTCVFPCKDGCTPIVNCKGAAGDDECKKECARACGLRTTSRSDKVDSCDTECTNWCSGISGDCGLLCDLNSECKKTCRSTCEMNGQIYSLVDIVYGIAAGIAAVMIILHGLKWLISEEPAERKEAKERIIYVLYGLLIIIIAVALVNTIYSTAITKAVCP